MDAESKIVVHLGQCHCGRVKFEFDGPQAMVAIDCNCSICAMKRNTHVFVNQQHFRLLSGADDLTTYTFNTGVAQHMFCKHCGICAFYRPRSNPDAYAVTIYCVRPGTLTHVTVRTFDGQHWEDAFARANLGALSRPHGDAP
uniref:CENP-V/GFA domain-containing protein n=1 Tax=Chlamydomonas leiostraca TaxID=1034604 RepID=A0A7S0R2Y1_9CHLO|mmetsp:Transcript_12401/g.30467  ORF Transcript_12401/g.30467 Transcript_12401/m.30467 type:complete len:142 (+) Transcript_12401:55-480(+)